MKRVLLVATLTLLSVLPAMAQRRAAAPEPANPLDGNADAAHAGEQIYNQNCTACHGINGGSGIIGPAIVNPGAQTFRGERSEFQLLEKIRNGVASTPMPAFKGKLTEDDILKIGAYIHELRGTALDSPTPGDVAHGEQIFYGKGECSSCHSINGKGGLLGPDLSNIAAVRKTVNIQSAMTKQEHRVWPDGGVQIFVVPTMDTYDAVRITLKSGEKIDGVLLNQDSYSVQAIGRDSKLHLLDRSEIAKIEKQPVLMPTDYDKRLSATEFQDLMAYLTRQGRKAPTSESARAASPD